MIGPGASATLTLKHRGTIRTIDMPVLLSCTVEQPSPRLVGKVRHVEITIAAPRLTERIVVAAGEPTPIYDRLMGER